MSSTIHIRHAQLADIDAIHRLHMQAFDASENELVAGVAAELLRTLDGSELLALVAEQNDELTGHIAFTKTTDRNYRNWAGFVLSPLGVMPDKHGTGIGSGLVTAGIDQLRSRGVDTIFVYGDPAYYGRFGFEVTTIDLYKPPYPLRYAHGWQVLELNNDDRSHPLELQCMEPFLDERLW